ncbi:MAG: hypothetical protein QM713_17685 [Arachnia sp.]
MIKELRDRDSGIVQVPTELIRDAAKAVIESTTASTSLPPDRLQLLAMHRRHSKLMHDSRNRRQSNDDLKTIINDLEGLLATETKDRSEAEACCPLEAPDLHLLAIAYRALRDEKADSFYRRATIRYRSQADFASLSPHDSAGTPPVPIGNANTKEVIDKAAEALALLALCMADHAHYLLEVAASPKEAVDLFRQSRQIFRDTAPPAFRIFVLCRESDGLLKLNRWAEAEVCLDQAIIIAEKEAPEHFITADAHRTNALGL